MLRFRFTVALAQRNMIAEATVLWSASNTFDTITSKKSFDISYPIFKNGSRLVVSNITVVDFRMSGQEYLLLLDIIQANNNVYKVKAFQTSS